MTMPHDCLLITLSYRVYRALLIAYPRQFRVQYREDMALVFRDSCQGGVPATGSATGLDSALGRRAP